MTSRIIVTCVLALAGLTASACGEDESFAAVAASDDEAQALYKRPLPFEQVSATPDRPRMPRITPVPSPAGGGDFDPSDALPLRDDAQVMQALLTLNSVEIAIAREALLRLRTAQARDFAVEMRDEHRQANLKLRAVLDDNDLKLKPSDVSLRLRERALAELDGLRAVNAVEIDKHFIFAQVRAHRRALAIIDELLLPHAENDDVQALVSAARADAERHLDLALRLHIIAEHDGLNDSNDM